MSGWGPFDLTGKRAVVTGGAMGIGYGIAARFREAGADVLIADIDADAADAAAKRLDVSPGRTAVMHVDVSAPGAPDEIVDRCVDELGGIEILVNNAGIYPMADIADITPEFIDRIFQVNVVGLILLSRAAGLRMADQGRGGSIINLASMDALHPSFPGLVTYGASKGAVVAATKHLALDLGPRGVRVNAIAPGAIITEGAAKSAAGEGNISAEEALALADQMVANMPLRRIGEPDDIGKVAVFLASSAADYMTGETVVVDGGYLLR